MELNKDAQKTSTVGQAALNLSQNHDSYEAEELTEAILKGTNSRNDWEQNILEATERGKQLFDGDFYVVVLTKKEKLLENVIRRYFLPRISCPTPTLDQIVFKFYRDEERHEHLWTIPDQYACKELLDNRSQVSPHLSPLLEQVVAFDEGKLDERCAVENGEGE